MHDGMLTVQYRAVAVQLLRARIGIQNPESLCKCWDLILGGGGIYVFLVYRQPVPPPPYPCPMGISSIEIPTFQHFNNFYLALCCRTLTMTRVIIQSQSI